MCEGSLVHWFTPLTLPKQQQSGYFRFYLAQGDLEAYAGYGVERHEDWVAEYTPYWYEAGERGMCEAVFSFKITAKNTSLRNVSSTPQGCV